MKKSQRKIIQMLDSAADKVELYRKYERLVKFVRKLENDDYYEWELSQDCTSLLEEIGESEK
jgi:hypothetical protein